MMALQVARIIADFYVFLTLTDDDILDSGVAVKVTERLADDLKALDKNFLRELVDTFPMIASEFSGEAQSSVRDIAHNFYLEEALAADDPVKLAELGALRDARDER